VTQRNNMTHNKSDIRLFYSLRRIGAINFGDNISPFLFERLTGNPVRHAKVSSCDFAAIGSIMEMIQRRRLKRLKRLRFDPIKIWGAGCLRPGGKISHFLIKPLALRGKLTSARLGVEGIPLGDPGILFNRLHQPSSVKKFRYGIVPHYTDESSPTIQKILDATKHSTLIRVDNDPLLTLKMIGECECIVSSNLHGLVAADSFGIPNYKCTFLGNLDGGSYKFTDYCTGIDRPACQDIPFGTSMNLDQIVNPSTEDFSYQKSLEAKAEALVKVLFDSL
jgi:pyruvyltransferase